MCRALLFAALLATAGPAQADITMRMAQIGIGSTVVMVNSEGQSFTHVHQGRKDGLYELRSFEGRNRSGTYLGSMFLDDKGQIVRQVAPNGDVVEFRPHRCMRTEGTCRYTRIEVDGTREERLRVTTPTDDGFLYMIANDEGIVIEGEVTLDRMGWSRSGWFRNRVTGRRVELQMLRSVYK